MTINFVSFKQFSSGIITRLLTESYKGFFDLMPEYKAIFQSDWQNFDKEVFCNLDTIGASGFVTVINSETIGFVSWDPRKRPEFAIIGHNCILPTYQRKYYGQQQIMEIEKRLRNDGFKRLIVSTSSHPFFEPAQKMYLKCGFTEKSRFPGEVIKGYDIIEYEMEI